jgi:regulator of chromosome condensation (RCC1) repeat-containing protein
MSAPTGQAGVAGMYQAGRPLLCPGTPAARPGRLGGIMTVLRSRRLAGLAGCAALALGLAGTAGAVPAQARVAAAVAPPPDVASWGLNNTGQLGDGTTTDRSRYVDIGAGNNIVQVAAGWTGRFAHGLEVSSDGTAWAWGFNGFGELGDGSTTSRLARVQVTGLTGVTQVAGGCTHSLALRSDGTVWAWGGNSAGELGRGTITDHEVTPAPVSELAGVTKIAAGCEFSLALRSDGTVWAWGSTTSASSVTAAPPAARCR